MESEVWIKGHSKKCPHCHTPIEKTTGCTLFLKNLPFLLGPGNHMNCERCQKEFCYRCCKPIEGYSHFNDPNSKCELFTYDGSEDDPKFGVSLMDFSLFSVKRPLFHVPEINRNKERMEIMETTTPKDSADRFSCPRCRFRHVKLDQNNQVTCVNCRLQFCFMCLNVCLLFSMTNQNKTITGLSHYREAGVTCKQHTPLGSVRAAKKPVPKKQAPKHEDDEEYAHEEKVDIDVVTDPSARRYEDYKALDELEEYDDMVDDVEDEAEERIISRKDSRWV